MPLKKKNKRKELCALCSFDQNIYADICTFSGSINLCNFGVNSWLKYKLRVSTD